MNSTPASDTDQDVTGAETAPQEPGHHVEERELPDFPLAVYSGHRPEQVLAAWGLTSLLPGALVRFDGPWATPIISWEGTKEQLAQTAAHELVRLTEQLCRDAMVPITTTTPARSAFNTVSTEAWERANGDDSGLLTGHGAVSALFDPSFLSDPKHARTDIPVRAAALTLYSGRSYTAKSVIDTWGLLLPSRTRMRPRLPTSQMSGAACDAIDNLLEGELETACAKPALRFSAYDPSPRTTTGYESGDVVPLTDLLALCGQLLLQSRQFGIASQSTRKALTWTLNPEPLTIEQVIDLHEAPPPHLPWPRWESAIVRPGSEAKFSTLHTAHHVPSQHGGHHA